MADDKKLYDALSKIAKVAAEAVGGRHEPRIADDDEQPSMSVHTSGCTIRALPSRLVSKATRHARDVFRGNAPQMGLRALRAIGNAPTVLRLTLDVTKYWGPTPQIFSVSFMDTPSAALRNKILSHMNAWSQYCGISFSHTNGTGKVRITRGPSGYWSYLGTDVDLIPSNQPTMNLQDFTVSTPDSEYHRVVRHETGHTMGFPHEHMREELVARIDPDKAYDWFWNEYGWDRETVDQQVLTPLDASSIYGTAADETSIMCYQLPGEITYDGLPIVGGDDINTTDYDFAASIYPKMANLNQAVKGEAAASKKRHPKFEADWDEANDVKAMV